MEYRHLPHGDEHENFGVLVAVPGVPLRLIIIPNCR